MFTPEKKTPFIFHISFKTVMNCKNMTWNDEIVPFCFSEFRFRTDLCNVICSSLGEDFSLKGRGRPTKHTQL
ncbi:hypothetical protein R3I93_016367 [Phoxinus phoxinus]|uniref:Uncharacterized protein n=1 Tax=Phoxinus phoxinus TaxID=58324 RepID=A0AAN9CKX3_9TELE